MSRNSSFFEAALINKALFAYVGGDWEREREKSVYWCKLETTNISSIKAITISA